VPLFPLRVSSPIPFAVRGVANGIGLETERNEKRNSGTINVFIVANQLLTS
jgi:hypothetical protein